MNNLDENQMTEKKVKGKKNNRKKRIEKKKKVFELCCLIAMK